MKRLLTLVTIIVAGIALLAAFSPAPTTEETTMPTTHAAAQAGTLSSMEACEYTRGKTTWQAECGTLTVPENWEKTNSRLITLPVIRIPSTSATPAEPVVWFQGGPGATNFVFKPSDALLANHDVLMVGYRGVDSDVELKCSGVMDSVKAHLGKDMFTDAAYADMRAATARCAADLEAAGVDLAGYTVPAVVKDVEAAREALGYEKINIYGASYGTRVAQLYAWMYPDSLNRVLMVGVNPPGHFLYEYEDFDALLAELSAQCAADPECSARTDNLAQTIYDVNHNMPDRWLVFPIDAGTVRLIMQFMVYQTPTMPMVIDSYLAAAEGDPSGLAMLSMMGKFAFPDMHLGDSFVKAGTLDIDFYAGDDSLGLKDSPMGMPLAELLWPMAATFPIEPVDAALRVQQPSDVDMLLVNGSLDFSTPPSSLEDLRPHYPNAQVVLLDGFGHVSDVEGLQPEAFDRMMTSYFDTGVADTSLYTPNRINFSTNQRLPLLAKLLVAGAIVVPLAVVGAGVFIWRRFSRK